MHMPPARASTLHSCAICGMPGIHPSDWAAHFRSGSQAVTAEVDSMPGPMVTFTRAGLPPRSSNTVGTNQEEIPGPVAMVFQTSSGVPGTSTSTCTDRRPEGSFLTLMAFPFEWCRRAWDAPRQADDVDVRPVRIR